MTAVLLDTHVLHRWTAEPDRQSQAALDSLVFDVRTIPISPSIAATAVDLPAMFPGDPADRLI